MKTFKDSFEKLPDDDKFKVFNLIEDAIRWREWDSYMESTSSNGSHAVKCIKEIVKVFEENNIHFDAYS